MACVLVASLLAPAFAPAARHVPLAGHRHVLPSALLPGGVAATAHAPFCARAPHVPRAVCSMSLLDRLAKSVNDPADESADYEFSAEKNDRVITDYLKRVERINALEPSVEALDDAGLREKAADLRDRVERGESLDAVLEEAFALVREAAWRALGLRHYDVQLVGGLALADGRLAEMATGEGKTLVATLPAFLYSLTGRGAHVVTCSDYLARRDAEVMGQVYQLLGLSVGIVGVGAPSEEKRAAYGSDVTYVTNSELGFDYLRDNLATDASQLVLRPLNYCIVDEADSILIDEARTPLIIADSTAADASKLATSAQVVQALERSRHYAVSEKEKIVELTEDGVSVASKLLGVDSIFSPSTAWAPYIVNALKAKELYIRDSQYIVEGDGVAIVDEFTGRVLSGRRWGDGLQQAVEAKEGVSTSNVSQVVASVTYQSLFAQYATLSGMSGTATQEAAEFVTVYGTEVVAVPTAAPVARRDYPDVVFVNPDGKKKAFLDEVKRMHQSGRPVLVGTSSVAASEELSEALTAEGVSHEVLNARADNAKRESLVIAQAGRSGAVTISTNMAGRGTDILLGGNPAVLARAWLREQLAAVVAPPEGLGGGARDDMSPPVEFPADPGPEAGALAAAVRDTLRASAPVPVAELDMALARAASNVDLEAEAPESAMRDALRKAENVFSEALVEEREAVIALGGLHVVGTQRHESRRIDAQLRGRAGRQGDPGSSRFILSLEDDLFRIFGGDKVKGLFTALRLSEDTPIESKQVTETLNSVQRKVEAYYRDVRRQLFQYDAVSARQRLAVYALRRSILTAPPDEVLDLLRERCETTAAGIIAEANKADAPDRVAAVNKLEQFFGGSGTLQLEPSTLASGRSKALDEAHALRATHGALDRKVATLNAKRGDLAVATARYLLLVQLDSLWKQHIADVRTVQDMVGLRSIAGRDPLIEFREEITKLYDRMLKVVAYNTVFSFFSYNP